MLLIFRGIYVRNRFVFKDLLARAREKRGFIQVLLGPRQVGKTTLALQIAEASGQPSHYISADFATLQDLSWLKQQWEIARTKAQNGKEALLIIDEIQKLPHWSEIVKGLWDEDTKNKLPLKVFILGSSPWLMQKGLSESLAGRFEIIHITHWSFTEMREHFGWDLEQYLYFGGYPGSHAFANKEDPSRFKQYICDSLIETTLSRDILLMTQVNKPILLRRLFQLGCNYAGQILSYSKMVGELSDAGNTTTLAHYLDLLSGASLVTGLQKFANQPVRQKGSSPKFAVFNTALMSAQSTKSFKEAKADPAFWGHLVESAVGAHLLNSIKGHPIEIFYWREADKEVDFVLQYGEKVIAIEVKKDSKTAFKRSGMDAFDAHFHLHKMIVVGKQGFSLEEFLATPIKTLF